VWEPASVVWELERDVWDPSFQQLPGATAVPRPRPAASLRPRSRPANEKQKNNSICHIKAKVEFFYRSTYTVNNLLNLALQSQKWQLIGKSRWCCSANAAIHCTR